MKLPSKASHFGELTDAMKKGLNGVIVLDTKDRKRANEELDSVLLVKLYDTCKEEIGDTNEVACVIRRFLTVRYGMRIESIDAALTEADLLDATTVGVLV